LALQLTPEEIERYRPYHTIPEFEWGYADYETGIWSAALKRNILNPDSFAAQAYQRGAECAMRRKIRRALSVKGLPAAFGPAAGARLASIREGRGRSVKGDHLMADRLVLTPEELERYAPYHTYPAFRRGYDDYMESRHDWSVINTVEGQAYDRGAECAMRRQRKPVL
jgi:hypothetical protein